MNQNLRQEPKTKTVQVNHRLTDYKAFKKSPGKVTGCHVEESEVKLNVEQLQLYEEVLRSVNKDCTIFWMPLEVQGYVGQRG